VIIGWLALIESFAPNIRSCCDPQSSAERDRFNPAQGYEESVIVADGHCGSFFPI